MNDQLIHQGYVFNLVQTEINGHIYDKVEHPGAVIIVPVIAPGEILVIRCFRPLIKKTVIEFPAGIKEPNEMPQVTALRELEEECGYKADTIVAITTFYPSYGMSNEMIEVFLARDLVKTQTNFDDEENIETLRKPIEEVDAMVRNGDLLSGAAQLSYLFIRTYKNHLLT